MKSYITICLIPLIISILPLLTLLGSLGLVFGGLVTSQITPRIGWVANGLNDIRTGQAEVLNLCRQSIELLDGRFHAVDLRKKTLEGHLRSTTVADEEAGEARRLIAHLDTLASQLYGELHKRRGEEASRRGKLEETDEFLERLRQAQQEPPESWLEFLGGFLMAIVRWLWELVKTIFSPFYYPFRT